MAKTQEALESVDVQGTSGGGLVKVNTNGKGVLKSVTIDPSLLVPDELEMLEDLLVAAVNDARSKAEKTAADKMKDVYSGLPIPPGMNLPI